MFTKNHVASATECCKFYVSKVTANLLKKKRSLVMWIGNCKLFVAFCL